MGKILFRILEFLGCTIIAAISSWPMAMMMSLGALLFVAICYPPTWGQEIITEDAIFAYFWIGSGVLSVLIGAYRVYKEFKE